MDASAHKVLARYQRSFRSLLEQIDERPRNTDHLPYETFNQISDEISGGAAALPQLLPAYDPSKMQRNNYYRPAAVRAYLVRALACIESELESAPAGEIVGPTLTFPFMADAQLRRIVQRDYPELLAAFAASCRKSCLILAGGLIETLLRDFLLQNRAAAQQSAVAPKEPDPHKWTLESMINVSIDRKPTLAPVQTASHTV